MSVLEALPPRVSFLLAVHNDAVFLPATLRSMLEQSFADFEIIAIDDASTDGTAEILQSADDPRVRYSRNETNLGQVPSLNRGLPLCRGEFVARIDGDDLCEPDRLAEQVHYLDEHPDLAGCASWTTEIDVQGVEIGGVEPVDDPDHIRWSMCHTLRLYHPSMMLRRHAYEQAGGYDVNYPATEDYELWTRLLAQGARLGVVPRRLIRYRRRSGSLSSLHADRQYEVGRQIATRHVSQILGNPCDPKTVEVMRSLLSWRELSSDAVSPSQVREALKLMAELRRRTLGSAARPARRAADDEVAQHLLRRGRFLLRDAPEISAQLAWYICGVPNHRIDGLKLAITAMRCARSDHGNG